MTEIRVERKAPIWPWIAGILLLILVVWLAFGAFGDDEPTIEEAAIDRPVNPAGDARTGAAGGVPQAVEAYIAFARGTTDLSPGPDHAYTAEGIRRLRDALRAHIEQNANAADTRARFERFNEVAERVQKDRGSNVHANVVREVFTSAVEVFESAKIEAGDVTNLRRTASSIAADTPLLEQTDRVREFFRQSADALERAARRS